MRLKYLLLVAFLLYIPLNWWLQRPNAAALGKLLTVGQEPKQELMTQALTQLFQRQEEISLLKLNYRYDITGEVLTASTYRWAFVNDYFAVDVGLAWGNHVHEIKQKIDYRQAARWLMWSAKQDLDEASLSEIKTHIGNIHLMPKEGHKDLNKAIHWIRAGDIVRIRGFLIDIYGSSGDLLMASSTSRDDTGGGACEIVLVEELQIGNKIYR